MLTGVRGRTHATVYVQMFDLVDLARLYKPEIFCIRCVNVGYNSDANISHNNILFRMNCQVVRY